MKGNRREKKKGRIGASFDDFLKQDGIYEAVTGRAIERVIARRRDALRSPDERSDIRGDQQ